MPIIVARRAKLSAPAPGYLPGIMLIAAGRRVQAGACHPSVGSARSAISPTMAVKEWLLVGRAVSLSGTPYLRREASGRPVGQIREERDTRASNHR